MALVQYGRCVGDTLSSVSSCLAREISDVRKYYSTVIEWESLPWEISGRKMVAPVSSWFYGAFQQVGAPKVVYVPWIPLWWVVTPVCLYVAVRHLRHTAL